MGKERIDLQIQHQSIMLVKSKPGPIYVSIVKSNSSTALMTFRLIVGILTHGWSGSSPSARKDDSSPTRQVPPTRGLDGAEQCVVTTRRSKLM